MLKWFPLCVQTLSKDLKEAKAPTHTSSQRQWGNRDGRDFQSSVMFHLTSPDLPCSPEGFLLSYHCFVWQGCHQWVIFYFVFCSILPLKSFVKGNVSPTYLDDVLSKSVQKRSLKAKEEEWRSEQRTSSGGGGGDQGQWKTEERESSKGLVMVSRCTDSKG